MTGPRFKPYSETKESGIEWLGQIPVHWSPRRLKTVLAQPVTDGPHETPDFLPNGVPFLSVDGIQEGELVFEGCRYIDLKAHEQYLRKCAPRRNDILLGKAASTGKIARVKVDVEFSIWSPLALIRSRAEECAPSFLEYALKSTGTQAQIDILCTSNTQKNISMADIPRIEFALPSIDEQQAVADFLDRETAKIDALVEKKERLIELLQEKRVALITHAVTKGLPAAEAARAGLDPNVPIRDSGIEWLGDVPEHWTVKKLGYGANLQGGYAFASGSFGTSGVAVVRMNNLKRGILDLSEASYVEREDCLADFDLSTGDLLWGMSGSIGETGSLGNFARVRTQDLPAQLNQRVGRFQLDNGTCTIPFLFYVIQTRMFSEQVLLRVTGTAQFNVSSAQVQSTVVPFPPIPEQQAIADFLDLETAKIDALTAKVGEAIERLKEYRAALISAAVTGKIDVRGEKA